MSTLGYDILTNVGRCILLQEPDINTAIVSVLDLGKALSSSSTSDINEGAFLRDCVHLAGFKFPTITSAEIKRVGEMLGHVIVADDSHGVTSEISALVENFQSCYEVYGATMVISAKGDENGYVLANFDNDGPDIWRLEELSDSETLSDLSSSFAGKQLLLVRQQHHVLPKAFFEKYEKRGVFYDADPLQWMTARLDLFSPDTCKVESAYAIVFNFHNGYYPHKAQLKWRGYECETEL